MNEFKQKSMTIRICWLIHTHTHIIYRRKIIVMEISDSSTNSKCLLEKTKQKAWTDTLNHSENHHHHRLVSMCSEPLWQHWRNILSSSISFTLWFFVCCSHSNVNFHNHYLKYSEICLIVTWMPTKNYERISEKQKQNISQLLARSQILTVFLSKLKSHKENPDWWEKNGNFSILCDFLCSKQTDHLISLFFFIFLFCLD